ncbi:MAG: hypothetical protein LBL76_10060 [Treponema sp.]|jgi:hypothetical protein|nr:hypothetical protein [Treponema sp.]
MKRIFLSMIFCIAVVTVLPLMAQEEESSGGSPYYYVNVPVERVYAYRKGYVVAYRTGVLKPGLGYLYLPIEWFADGPRAEEESPPKGEVILLGPGKSWPYLTIYRKDGAFSHVRLYVRQERTHESWGGIPLTVNIDDRFEGVEDIKLAY